MTVGPQPDLVVLSHLRWTWVWQRPQHLVSRFAAAARAEPGARTWFVEEPVAADVDSAGTCGRGAGRDHPGLARGAGRASDPDRARVRRPRGRRLRRAARPGCSARRAAAPPPTCWLYTPMALDIAQRLDAGTAGLRRDGRPGLVPQRTAGARAAAAAGCSREADVVFTGGRSLHRGDARPAPARACTCSPAASRPGTTPASRSLRTAARPSGRRLRRRDRRAAGPRS